jgi:hypothetical protein
MLRVTHALLQPAEGLEDQGRYGGDASLHAWDLGALHLVFLGACWGAAGKAEDDLAWSPGGFVQEGACAWCLGVELNVETAPRLDPACILPA